MSIESKKIFIPQPILFQEVFEIIVNKLGPIKALQFWLSLEKSEGNYLQLRKKLFRGESITQLARKIKKFNR